MTELYSQYTSGTQFTAGAITGSSLGTSGINPLVDRLNSISTSDNLITGSVISGTSTVFNGICNNEQLLYKGYVILQSGTNLINSKVLSIPANSVGSNDMLFFDFGLSNQVIARTASVQFAFYHPGILNGSVSSNIVNMGTGSGYTGRITIFGQAVGTEQIGFAENSVHHNTNISRHNNVSIGGTTFSNGGSLVIFCNCNDTGSYLSLNYNLKRIII